MMFQHKDSFERARELKRSGVSGQTAAIRLCSEFKESFFMMKNKLMEEYKTSEGKLAQRCIELF